MTRPTITPLPTPPNRQQGAAEFATRADDFLSALPVFGGQIGDVADFVDGRAVAAEQFAANAQGSASTASSHANTASQARTDAQAAAQQTAADRQAVEDALIDGPVIQVNGQSGVVDLTAVDVGAAAVDMSNVSQSAIRNAAGIGTNAVGNRTVSTADPSGGENGDIHYKV